VRKLSARLSWKSLSLEVSRAGVDARWAVIEGNPEFFTVTKRIHNNIYGPPR